MASRTRGATSTRLSKGFVARLGIFSVLIDELNQDI